MVLELWNVRQNRITIAIEVLSQPMFGDMDRQVQQFNMLYDFEVVGWRESKFANVSGVNLVGDFFVHTLGLQRLTKLSLMTFLSATFGLLTTIGLLLRRLHDIAGRRLGGVR